MPSRRAQRRDRVAPTTRARHRRRAHLDLERDNGVLLGWCETADDLPELRQLLHDTLIAMMGEHRTGGVRWRWWDGDAADEVLTKMVETEGNAPELLDYYRRLRAKLREFGGWICMATAPGGP